MHTLPPLPRHLDLPLLDSELARIETKNPWVPKSVKGCVTCKGKKTFRWYTDDSRNEVAEFECDCVGQYKLLLHMLHAGIELGYQKLTWRDADEVEPAAVEVLHDYRRNAEGYAQEGLGLVLIGSKGAGKTMGATLLAKDLMRTGVDVYKLLFQDFIQTFAEGWAHDEAGKAAQQRFDARIRNAGLLVLDDAGRESGLQNHVVAILDVTLRHRVAAQLPTMITSNKTLAEMGELYSSNAMSLLSESMTEHVFHGVDYRDKANQRRHEEKRAGLTRPIVL